MKAGTVLLVLASVALSASAQLLLKAGMASGRVQSALRDGPVRDAALAVVTHPSVLTGLAAFAMGAVVWLMVLARIDVSAAYPCAALGIVLTTLGGALLFGEPVSILRLAGIAVITGGVILVALG